MKQLEKLLLMPDYFRALAKEWLNILFGETLVGIGFLIWWALGAPTNHRLILVFVLAMFVAGYYAWRGDHIRLIPRLEIKTIALQENPVNDARGTRRIYVQVIPECLTDAPVSKCTAHLVRVYKRYTERDDWELTDVEPGILEWSFSGYDPNDLHPNIAQRLNVCFRTDTIELIQPAIQAHPLRWRAVFDITAIFRFDIRVTSPDCAPADVSVSISISGRKWNEPEVKIL
jgi:hypothetical protein